MLRRVSTDHVQLGVTALSLLGVDITQLTGVAAEGTKPLPGLSFLTTPPLTLPPVVVPPVTVAPITIPSAPPAHPLLLMMCCTAACTDGCVEAVHR